MMQNKITIALALSWCCMAALSQASVNPPCTPLQSQYDAANAWTQSQLLLKAEPEAEIAVSDDDCFLTIDNLNVARDLNLSQRLLSDLDAMSWITSPIVRLDLSANRLETLPESIQDHSELEVLDLSSNDLRHIPGLQDLKKLRLLDLSSNKITSLVDIATRLPQSLEVLSLSYNSLTTLSGLENILEVAPNLRALELCGLPSGIPGLDDLTSLSGITVIDDCNALLPKKVTKDYFECHLTAKGQLLCNNGYHQYPQTLSQGFGQDQLITRENTRRLLTIERANHRSVGVRCALLKNNEITCWRMSGNAPLNSYHDKVETTPHAFDNSKPASIMFSYVKPKTDMTCIQINEPSDKAYWQDNYLCVDFPLEIFWSFVGRVGSHNYCVSWNNPLDPNFWGDNQLCTARDIGAQFSHLGAIPDKSCIAINEPSDAAWQDAHYCWDQEKLDAARAAQAEEPLAYKLHAGPICGAPNYHEKRSHLCGVESYNIGNSSVCGILGYNQAQGQICGVKCNTKCTKRNFFNQCIREEENCTANTCRDPSFGVVYKNCAHSNFGVKGYKKCHRPEFGVSSYPSCLVRLSPAELVDFNESVAVRLANLGPQIKNLLSSLALGTRAIKISSCSASFISKYGEPSTSASIKTILTDELKVPYNHDFCTMQGTEILQQVCQLEGDSSICRNLDEIKSIISWLKTTGMNIKALKGDANAYEAQLVNRLGELEDEITSIKDNIDTELTTAGLGEI